MTKKCVHKGCGKSFDDPEETCTYHPGPPEFHEGQKGWKCCKTRVLTFDEFLSIPPCTTGKHSTVDDTPKDESDKATTAAKDTPAPTPVAHPVASNNKPQRAPVAQAPQPTAPPTTAPTAEESDSDGPLASIPLDAACKRRGCNVNSDESIKPAREGEICTHHPGQPIFHEGSKGWTCCKRRVLEFDEFMKIEGCKQKTKHLFVGSKKSQEQEQKIKDVRHDYYQTQTTVIATFFLKKIDKNRAKVRFISAQTLSLDLPTADHKHYQADIPLFGPIKTEESSFKIMGTKLELTLVKAAETGWATLRSDEQRTNEIIQVGPAGRA